MTDLGHDLLLGVHLAHQGLDPLVAAELVGGPAARDDDAVQIAGGKCAGGHVGGGREAVLAGERGVGLPAGDHDLGALLPEPHGRDPELEILE